MNDLMMKERKQVEISEVDYMGEYQIYHLFHCFSELATKNAKKIGMWDESMMQQYGWVVAKQTLHLNQPICYQDILELSTTIDNGSFVAFPRYYFIKKDNQEIGYCSSLWTLIDIHKRRIVAPKRIGLSIPVVEQDRHLEEPQNINIDIPMEYIMTRKVVYSDVDTNQHMNNTRYIQWALDIIEYDIHRKYYISDITIQYKKEIVPLIDVQLYLAHQDKRYIVEGRGENEIVYFTIEFCFCERSCL